MAIKPELLSAAKIFVEELGTHLDFMRDIIAQIDAGSPSEEILKQNANALEHRLHTVKGGAGFLQIENIQALATRGESLFREGQVSADSDAAFQELRVLVSELDQMAEELQAEIL